MLTAGMLPGSSWLVGTFDGVASVWGYIAERAPRQQNNARLFYEIDAKLTRLTGWDPV
jgi:hypothetical protein